MQITAMKTTSPSRSCAIVIRRLVTFGAVSLATGLATAACGTANDAGSSPGNETAAAVASPEQLHAESIVLQEDDFPVNWEDVSDPTGQDSDKRCYDLSQLPVRGRARSGPFAPFASFASVTSAALVLATDAQSAFERLTSEAVPCLRAIGQEFASSATTDEGLAVRVTGVGEIGFPPVGEATRAFEAVMEMKAGDVPPNLSQSIHLELVLIKQGRSVASLQFIHTTTPPSTLELAEELELSKKVAARM